MTYLFESLQSILQDVLRGDTQYETEGVVRGVLDGGEVVIEDRALEDSCRVIARLEQGGRTRGRCCEVGSGSGTLLGSFCDHFGE